MHALVFFWHHSLKILDNLQNHNFSWHHKTVEVIYQVSSLKSRKVISLMRGMMKKAMAHMWENKDIEFHTERERKWEREGKERHTEYDSERVFAEGTWDSIPLRIWGSFVLLRSKEAGVPNRQLPSITGWRPHKQGIHSPVPLACLCSNQTQTCSPRWPSDRGSSVLIASNHQPFQKLWVLRRCEWGSDSFCYKGLWSC